MLGVWLDLHFHKKLENFRWVLTLLWRLSLILTWLRIAASVFANWLETYEFQEWYDLDDEESYNLEELLEDIESSCSTVNRETATITTYSKKGERYELNVTGGMTWGDSPTDVYDAFNRAAFFENVYDLAVDCSVEYIKMYT